MNRIEKAFAKGKAFIPFITGGDPSLAVTERLIYAMEQAGADLIEIGLPFSDPIAEGAVIQEANERALAAGTTTDRLFDMIAPDLPWEEKGEIAKECEKYGIIQISMIAPTSRERIAKIAGEAKGFVYCVSSLGVTGVRSEITTDIGAMIRLVRENTSIPCAVGFGISEPAQAKRMAALSDGAIVGSAIVKLAAKYGEDCVEVIAGYVKEMKEAVKEE